MAISIDWANRVIFVPKLDLQLVQSVPSEIRELDLNIFRLALKDLEDSEDGMSFPTTHNHNTLTQVGGVTLARVVELINDYTVTFENGQYAVNLIGANTNVGDRVNVNQVSVRSSNSAGLIQTREIEFASFMGAIALDLDNGFEGSAYPIGTFSKPSNNIVDARFIANLRGLDSLILLPGNFVFGGSDDLSGLIIKGEHATQTMVTINPAANVSNCEFRDLFLVNSTMDGIAYLNHVAVNGVTNFSGFMENCLISGVTMMSNLSNSYFVDCKSGCVGLGSSDLPKIDFSGTGPFNVAFRNWSGPIKILNSTDAGNTICIDVTSGSTVILDSTCTDGIIYIRGVCHVINNSTMTVSLDAQITKATVADEVRVELTPELMHLAALENGLTDPQATMLLEIYRLYGLDPTKPLIVNTISRTAGVEITQQITTSPTQTVVTRV